MSSAKKRPGKDGLNSFANCLRDVLGLEKLYHGDGKERDRVDTITCYPDVFSSARTGQIPRKRCQQ